MQQHEQRNQGAVSSSFCCKYPTNLNIDYNLTTKQLTLNMSEQAINKTEQAIKDKYEVEIFKPTENPNGITVFLPGTMLTLSSYKSTYETLVASGQIVIAFKYMNPFPIVGRSHQKMAEDVRDVVKAYAAVEPSLTQKYSVVGHSLGGKVALMVAAKYDIDKVDVIMALDPVDDKPQELTAPKSNPKTNLNNSKAKEIHLFQSEKGGQGFFPQAPKNKNASVIRDIYGDKITSFTLNAGAGHMSYRDNETDEASKEARESVQQLVKKVF